jgi:hypothetical protein
MKTFKPAGGGPKTQIKRPRRPSSIAIYPRDLETRYGISSVTRWRWERDKLLPPRDFRAGTLTGWKIATLLAYEATTAPASVFARRADSAEATA